MCIVYSLSESIAFVLAQGMLRQASVACRWSACRPRPLEFLGSYCAAGLRDEKIIKLALEEHWRKEGKADPYRGTRTSTKCKQMPVELNSDQL